MKKYQVTIKFDIDDEFTRRLPMHRRLIDQLLSDRIIEQYVVSIESMQSWITINGESAEDVRETLEQSPLKEYWLSMEIDEIFVFDSVAYQWPEISHN